MTQIQYPFIPLVVAESEAEEYRKGKNEIVTCPDSVQGNVSRVRNWILDENKEADCVVIIDDDCMGVRKWENQNIHLLNSDELMEFAERAAIMCEDVGARMWGVNCVPDKGAYREHMPFGFVSYIGSPFSGHCKSPIRYDLNLPLKEDYDITLQHMNKYRKVLRFNQFHYDVKQAEQVGGCSVMRSYDKEKQQFEALQKKWGASIVAKDFKSKRSFDFNPILKIPIRGV